MPNNKTPVNLCLEALDKSCASIAAVIVETANYGDLKRKGDHHKIDCVIPVMNAGTVKEGDKLSKIQLKPLCSKSTANQFGTMSIMYGTSKSKKGYNNAINRKRQNQQQILNSLKSWNVQIAPSGLDKPEVELPAGTQQNGSHLHGTITHSQHTPELKGFTRETKDLIAGTAGNNEQENRCPETETNNSATKKRAAQEVKYNKSKQKEQSEKKSLNNVHGEQVSSDKKDSENSNDAAVGIKAVSHAHSTQAGNESSSRFPSEPVVVSDDIHSSTEEASHASFAPMGTSVSRGNYQKNSHLKGRGSAPGWGWNQRQSFSGQPRDFAGSRIAAGQVMEKAMKVTDEIPAPGNGNLKELPNRLEHHLSNNQSFSLRESLTIHPNQPHSHQHPPYMHHPEQQHQQYLDHNHSAQQNSNGALHQYSFEFIRDVGQKMSHVDVGSSSVNAMFRATNQVNYNFTPQFQQQMMQHYHNSHALHQQNHSTGQASNRQLHRVATQHQQQQPYTHHSPGAYAGGEDISCHLSPQNGGGDSGGGGGGVVVNEPKPYPNYTVHGTGEIQNTISSSSSQNFEHPAYVYNRNGNFLHQQQQHGVNHQHPMYQNNNQQYQVDMNSYHQNNNYQYHNRNVTGMRGNQPNYLPHGGGGGTHREEGCRNGKKMSWNGNVSKGKMGAAQTNGGKHFNKVQNSGYGYRRSYQHYHNHPVGGGHSQFYDHMGMSQQQQQQQQQQQPLIPQQHHKQQHLHRNLVYVRGYDRGHGAVLPQEYGGDAGSVAQHEAERKGLIHSAPSSPTSKSSLDMEVSPAHSHDTEHGRMGESTFDSEGDAVPCEANDEVVTEKQDRSVLPDEDEFELKELCIVPRSSSSSSMVSIPSTESSAISSIISQTQLLECTNASVHEYDSDSSHSSDFRDASNRYSKYGQMSCGQVYRSSSSTSGISSSATNPHSNEFIPSIPSSLHASSAGLSELIVRSHSYHGSHQNLTAYGSARSAGETSSPIGSPTGTLRPVSGTQSVPIFGELFANSSHNLNHSTELTVNHSSAVSFGSSSSLEVALRSSSSSLPASSVPPNDSQSMQSGHPKKRSQSGRTSPAVSHEQYRSAAVSRGQAAFGSNSGRKHNNQVSLSYVHRTSLPSDFQYTPADRFILRAHDIELKVPPSRLSNGTVWDGLSEAIWVKFCHAQQTADKYLQKMQLWRDLYICIKQGFPKYGLYLVGSTISGFGADNSDVDMCLVSRSGPGYYDPRNEALQNLMLVKNYFMSMPASSFDQFCLIQAKVPILRFQDSKNGIEVDLNYNNCVGIRNTHLLHCYSQMDWRVRPLVLVVKLWAQHHNINDAKSMTISSYSLVLMVIHFLQYGVKPSVLPCLHSLYPEKFMKIIDINNIEMIERIEPYPTDNNETLGELLLQFLEYFKDFDYAHYAISVRTATIIPIEECRQAKSYKNDVHQWKHLCIEEPFDLTNTARSVFDGEVFEQIKGTIAASWRMLKDTKDLSSLFGAPLFTPVTSTLSITS